MSSNSTSVVLPPVIAVRRGFNAIFSLSKFGATDLEAAARAGALCKVIRTGEYARTLREFSLSEGPSYLRVKIHGRASLPEGYGLAIVPWNAVFQNDKDENNNPITICSDWSVIKILVAIAQLLFAIATLYRTKGDHIDQFGYAAFGLIYPTMYLVQTRTMLAAQNDGGAFEGIVGALDEDVNDAHRDTKRPSDYLADIVRGLWWAPLCWLPLAITLIIIWALSRFRPGNSTLEERILTMAWLAMGSWAGVGAYAQPSPAQYNTKDIYKGILISIGVSLVAAAPVKAGFRVVAREILGYGICTRVE
ncbi:hypothetical protein BKA60DRAFT_626035 [Fusarium oxysporum]|nr:hypothetical protein BKA60DRAFT_626035 [Fusarium oxysporum]